jgi:hypothetical protein
VHEWQADLAKLSFRRTRWNLTRIGQPTPEETCKKIKRQKFTLAI